MRSWDLPRTSKAVQVLWWVPVPGSPAEKADGSSAFTFAALTSPHDPGPRPFARGRRSSGQTRPGIHR
jgi:hypothetical protein